MKIDRTRLEKMIVRCITYWELRGHIVHYVKVEGTDDDPVVTFKLNEPVYRDSKPYHSISYHLKVRSGGPGEI